MQRHVLYSSSLRGKGQHRMSIVPTLDATQKAAEENSSERRERQPSGPPCLNQAENPTPRT